MTASNIVQVTGRAGEAIALPICQPPATGYAWAFDLPEGLSRVADAPGREPAPDQTLGSPAGGALRVTGKAGRYRIVATLARPWDREHPIQSVAIDLMIE